MLKFATLATVSLSLIAAIAASPTQARSVSIGTSDLDLSTAKGQRTLDRRIANASATVCDSGAGYLDHGVRRAERLCRVATIRAATAQAKDLASPRLASR